jgi:hypothetical protein
METKNLLLIGIALFVGYSAQFKPEPEIKPVATIAAISEVSPAEKVKAEFKKIESKEDRILIHKMFSGASDYLKNCKSLSQTGQFDPILGRVQNSYGWKREKYPKFTDEVSNYLKAMGFETPKTLDNEESRKEFQKIFEGLAEATHE